MVPFFVKENLLLPLEYYQTVTLPETNSSQLKMGGWNPSVLKMAQAYFSGANLLLVSGSVYFISTSGEP